MRGNRTREKPSVTIVRAVAVALSGIVVIGFSSRKDRRMDRGCWLRWLKRGTAQEEAACRCGMSVDFAVTSPRTPVRYSFSRVSGKIATRSAKLAAMCSQAMGTDRKMK